MATQMIDLSIIIVNFNTVKYTCECIRSIYKYSRDVVLEIIVIDNNSTDDSQNIIINKFPDINWFSMGYNSGFARANNIGIKHAKGKYVLLLNSDTEVLEQTLKNCIDYFEKNDELIALGCQLVNKDFTKQVSGGYEFDFRWFWFNIPILGRFIKIIYPEKKTEQDQLIDSLQYVDWIMGAFLMVRTKLIKTSGLMDENFFLYAEELEWCNRLKNHGKLAILKNVKCIHKVGGTSEQVYNTVEKELIGKRERQRILSILLMIRKSYGAVPFLWYLLLLIKGIPFYYLYSIIKKQNITYANQYFSNAIYWLSYALKIALLKNHFYKAN